MRVQARKHLPFFDAAYLGFASGDVDVDAAGLREFAARGMHVVVAQVRGGRVRRAARRNPPPLAPQSMSKNLGLYSERTGALHVLTGSKAEAEAVLSRIAVRASRPGGNVRVSVFTGCAVRAGGYCSSTSGRCTRTRPRAPRADMHFPYSLLVRHMAVAICAGTARASPHSSCPTPR